MAGSSVGPTTASQPPPPPPLSASLQERLHAAWLQHAAASAGEGGAAGLDGCGSSQSARQLSSVGRGHTPDAGPTCHRSPGSAPTNLHSSSAAPCPRLQPRLAVMQDRAQAAVLGSRTLPAPAAACMPPLNRLDPAVAAAPSRPAAPEVQLDASDWELLELLRQEAEAAAAAAAPAGLAHTCLARSPHSRHPPTQHPPVQRPQRRQPPSPLARQLAALRSSAAQQQQDSTACATGAEGQRLLCYAAVSAQPLAGSSGSSSAQPPASPQGEAGALLAQAVCLLVPQELLAEAEVAAAAASNAAPCVAEADKAMASANASDAVGPEGKQCSSGAVGMDAAVEQQAVLGSSMEHTEAPVHGPELAAAAEALRRHCEEGRYDAARELLGQAGPAHAAALLEACDSLGRSALMLACQAGHGRLIKLLLRKGAGLDAQDAGGLTCLHHAVLGGHRAVAQHLLKVGADATLRSRAGVSGAELIAAWAAQQQQEGQRELPMQQQEQQECSVPG